MKTQFNSTQLDSAQLNLTQLDTTWLSSTQLDSTRLSLTQLDSARLSLFSLHDVEKITQIVYTPGRVYYHQKCLVKSSKVIEWVSSQPYTCWTANRAMVANKQLWQPQMCTLEEITTPFSIMELQTLCTTTT